MTKKLDKLLKICATSGIHLERTKLPKNLKAILYSDKETDPVISIDYSICTYKETACVLAEEIGHYYTSCGNLLTDSNLHKSIINKQENIARRWAFKYMISLSDLIAAHKAACTSLYEVAEHLDITEEFLREATKVYGSIYGTYIVHQGYRIYFDPLWVISEEEGAATNENQST